MVGNWSGDGRQEFAYVTPGSAGGFALAVFESTLTGIVWKGIWYSSTSIDFASTTFIPADMNNDGLLDLYYATNRPGGMDVALAINTGTGLSYVGQQWNPSALSTATTKFIAGNWSGDGRQEFAYVTPGSAGGFALAVFESTLTGIVWKGIWYSSTSIDFASTTFIPADMNNDGLLDLYYATNRPGGMDVALAINTGTGLSYVGQQWNPSALSTATTKFLSTAPSVSPSHVVAPSTASPERVPFTGQWTITATWGAPSGGYHSEPAIDVAMTTGTWIYAAGDGEIVEATIDSRHCDPRDYPDYVQGCIGAGFANSGTRLRIRHDDGSVSVYLHLSSIVAGINVGARVTAGQHIADSGNTGISEGPHLHYAEVVGSTPVDPGSWIACHAGTRTDYTGLQNRKGETIRNDSFSC